MTHRMIEIREALISAAEKLGLEIIEITVARHQNITVKHPVTGLTGKYSFSCTPSDVRTIKNSIRDIKRLALRLSASRN